MSIVSAILSAAPAQPDGAGWQRGREAMHLRLQASVAILFTVLTVFVVGTAVWLFQGSSRQLKIETAGFAMRGALHRTEAALDGILAPVGHAVDLTAAVLADPTRTTDPTAHLALMRAQVAGLDQIYSLYYGIAETGQFVQVLHVPPGAETLGPARLPVPAGAVQALRVIRAAADRRDVVQFVAADGTVLSEQSRPTDFDPRTRPWFEAAKDSPTRAVTPVYTFASIGRPGITLSSRVEGPGRNLKAVVGVDMTLDRITQLLADVRVDGVGEVFLMDPQGGIFATSEASDPTGQTPLTKAAAAAWAGQGETVTNIRLPGFEEDFLVSMAAMTTAMPVRPVIGVVVPADHFIGAIEQTTQRVILLSGLIGALGVLVTVLLSRLVSQSLGLVAQEAGRISDFDLTGDFRMSSRIDEVDQLGDAVSKMKQSLKSFAAYVPREVVRAILADGGSVRIGGEARDITMMFSDIEGFTAKSEHLPPEMALADLSRYFDAMDKAILDHGGTLDKYIGDAVMAIWNAPLSVPDHAIQACRAVLACKQAEAALNASAPAGRPGIFPTRTRFGLHSGRAVVGNVGSAGRLQYTAIGGAVNLASRLEGLNKTYGTEILVSQAVVDQTEGRFVFRSVDLVAPAGTTLPVPIFELLGEAEPGAAFATPQALRDEAEAWERAWRLYRDRDWQGASAAFRALAAQSSRPTLVALYLERCKGHLALPPPPDWDGITIIRRK